MNKKWVLFLTMTMLFTLIQSISAQNLQLLTYADYYGGIEPSDDYETLGSRIFLRPTAFGISPVEDGVAAFSPVLVSASRRACFD